MNEPVEFLPFPKIPRLKRSIVITEKIDGTNACVRVLEDGRVLAQSRNRSTLSKITCKGDEAPKGPNAE